MTEGLKKVQDSKKIEVIPKKKGTQKTFIIPMDRKYLIKDEYLETGNILVEWKIIP